MFVDRYIPTAPSLSVLLLAVSVAIAVADRRICAVQDGAAEREHRALQLGYHAGLKQLANR